MLSVLVHLAAWLPPACASALTAIDAAGVGGRAGDLRLANLQRNAASLASLIASQVKESTRTKKAGCEGTHGLAERRDVHRRPLMLLIVGWAGGGPASVQRSGTALPSWLATGCSHRLRAAVCCRGGGAAAAAGGAGLAAAC